jgi:predicted AlkP superfamily phosphohydrolase/phosphomutase
LERDEWDLAVFGFCETHPAGHYLWPSGVDAVDAGDEDLFRPLSNVYAAVDEALGRLRARLPSDAALMVVSGDGVRPNRCGWHLLPAVLTRLGYTSSGGTRAVPESSSSPSGVGRIQHLIPADMRRQLAATLPWRLRDRLGTWLQTRSIAWSRTTAFTLPTDLEGCIRLNVRGREPHGIVEPGSQYADLCLDIRARLEELVNPVSDLPAVRRVWIRNEVFSGPRQETLPDLIVTWNDDAPLTAVTSARCGRIEGINPDPRPGTHSTSGFLIAAGPGIPRAYRGCGRLTDVAPTIMECLRLRQTDGLDGRPLEALVGHQ